MENHNHIHTQEFESQSSALAGIYRQNAFYIKMESIFDLNPEIGSPPQTTLAMHTHEYVHFLHNTSTAAGQLYIYLNLVVMGLMRNGCDIHGYFLGQEYLSKIDNAGLIDYVSLMKGHLGTTHANTLTECKNIESWKCGVSKVAKINNVPVVNVAFTAENSVGVIKNQEITIGLSFISEGIAYEIDREMRRNIGIPESHLDLHIPVFPYIAYRTLINSWCGRNMQCKELILIGIAALMHQTPGGALVTVCREIKQKKKKSVELILNKFIKKLGDDSNKIIHKIEKFCLSNEATESIITVALNEYLKMIKAGAQIRKKYWAPEIFFILKPIKVFEFYGYIGMLLDCLVIQLKPEKCLEMTWIGPGLVASTDEFAQKLLALQSAIHFSQLHITKNALIVSTEKLNNHPCPFAGGCKSEQDDNFPPECTTKPWKRFRSSAPGEKVCAYAAGVKSLANSRNCFD